MKGPFTVDKEYPKWDEEGNYKPLIKTIPNGDLMYPYGTSIQTQTQQHGRS
jgi:hypothetical protein